MMFKRFIVLAACFVGMWVLGAGIGIAAQTVPKQVVLTEADEGSSKTLYRRQVLTIELTANPSTGYRWVIANMPKGILKLKSSGFVHPEIQDNSGEVGQLGAREKQRIEFEATAEGESTITLVYKRPWELTPINRYSINVSVVSGAGIQLESPPQKAQQGQDNTPTVRAATFKLTKSGPRISLGPVKKIRPLWEMEQMLQSTGNLTPIMSEDFEGDFPGTNWEIHGDPTWGTTDYRAYTGSKSAYCVGGGTSAVDPPGPYPDNVSSRMIYGPFDLSDAKDAVLSFYHWTVTESDHDGFLVGVSVDGSLFHGQFYTGDWASRAGGDGWYPEAIDLNELSHLNLSGLKHVWIEFTFFSDNSVEDEGVYIDDISLQKEVWTPPNLPSSFDWRERHGVTPIKDQGSCGSCWAFSTVGTMEANIQIKDATAEDLSEQFLVSCNTGGGTGSYPWGCDGGCFAFDYFMDRVSPGQSEAGAVTEEEKPYVESSFDPDTDTEAPCCGSTPCPFDHQWKISEWSCVDENAEGPSCISYKGSGCPRMPSIYDIKEAIMRYGPISAGVFVGGGFQNYKNGVFETDEFYGWINHAIVLVGWDDSLGRNGAWILRNSWDTSWGDDGYMYIGYGISGVGIGASYVVYGPRHIFAYSADFNGDGKTDIALWRMFNGTWHIKGIATTQYGTAGDIPVPGDYNGDGHTDIAVFRPSNGAWYIKGIANTHYGTAGDIPVPGDYNGDGHTDIAVFRPSNGAWYIKGIANTHYGTAGDIPVPGDYNGDGHTDIAVFRPSNGKWYVRGQSTVAYGTAGDIPVAK